MSKQIVTLNKGGLLKGGGQRLGRRRVVRAQAHDDVRRDHECMPKLKGMRFTTAVLEHNGRHKNSVEEAMMERCLAGVSARRIEDVSEIPRGLSVSAVTVSNLNEKTFDE